MLALDPKDKLTTLIIKEKIIGAKQTVSIFLLFIFSDNYIKLLENARYRIYSIFPWY